MRNEENDDLVVMMNTFITHINLLIIRVTRNIKTTNQLQDRLLIRENIIHNSRHHWDDEASEVGSNSKENDEVETGNGGRAERAEG